ncbi:MAG: glucokinase [Pseudomonadota bacterium]
MAKAGLLVGDVGGTNARFAVATPNGELADIMRVEVRDFATSDEALEHYLDGLSEPPSELCIASAGKRSGDRVTLTNAHWSLAEGALQSRFGFTKAKLVNDFEALAVGAAGLPTQQMVEVQAGTAMAPAPRLCLGPGTGFGQALLLQGTPPQVISTEGGFRLLPTRTERDRKLYQRLETILGEPPILEEAVSGRGLVQLLAALRDEAQTIDPPALTDAALKGPGDERDAVLWFFDLLATAAADAAVMLGAWGGVIIGGGVVPRLISLLDHGAFRTTFARPCQMQEQLAAVPIHVLNDGTAALRGAAVLGRAVSSDH